MKRWLLIGLVFLLTVTIVACGKKTEETLEPGPEESPPIEEPLEDPANEDQIDEEPEKIVLPYTAPLTGLGSEKPVDQRIIMTVIENHPDARPQSGLNKADLVYEILAEGNITRFAAFFHSEFSENVGPVRSIRPYFIELGTGYDALLVHAGWSPEAESIIKKKGMPSLNGLEGRMDPYFWRVGSRKAPHNLYTDFSKIKEAAKKVKYREEGKIPKFLFHLPEEEAKGESATEVTVKYYSGYQVYYKYDSEKKVYLRTMNKDTHTDLITGEQLSTTNIMVIKTKHRVLDSEGRLSIDLKSGGDGYLIQRGKVQEITWKNVDGIIYPFKDNKELPLYPGKTWINIIPNVNATVSFN